MSDFSRVSYVGLLRVPGTAPMYSRSRVPVSVGQSVPLPICPLEPRAAGLWVRRIEIAVRPVPQQYRAVASHAAANVGTVSK